MDRYIIQSLPKTKRVRLQTDENVDTLFKYLDKNYFIYLYLDNFFLSKHNTDNKSIIIIHRYLGFKFIIYMIIGNKE
jgi:hypothetical protein